MPISLRLNRAAIFAVGTFVSALCQANSNSAQTVLQHDAHQHGQIEINIVREAAQLFIEVNAPGSDVVGFENTADTDEQRQLLKQALQTLAQPDKLFSLTTAASCKLLTASVTHNFATDSHEAEEAGAHEESDAHEEHEEHQDESGHGSFIAQYQFNCVHPAKLTRMSTTWFEHFPNSELIKLQLLSESGQSAQTLTHNNLQINF